MPPKAEDKPEKEKPVKEPKIVLTEDQKRIFGAILQNKALVRKDPKWRFWHEGDDEKTCPLLMFVHTVENNGGYLIFIPDCETVSPKIPPITRKDITGE